MLSSRASCRLAPSTWAAQARGPVLTGKFSFASPGKHRVPGSHGTHAIQRIHAGQREPLAAQVVVAVYWAWSLVAK